MLIIKNVTMPFFNYNPLKLWLKVFLEDHTIAMVTYCVTKMITLHSIMIGQFFLYHDCGIQ